MRKFKLMTVLLLLSVLFVGFMSCKKDKEEDMTEIINLTLKKYQNTYFEGEDWGEKTWIKFGEFVPWHEGSGSLRILEYYHASEGKKTYGLLQYIDEPYKSKGYKFDYKIWTQTVKFIDDNNITINDAPLKRVIE